MSNLKTDGSESLVDNFGGEEAFIKKVVKDCYFFDPEIVKERFDMILKHLNVVKNADDHSFISEKAKGHEPIRILPSRKSEKKYTYKKCKGDLSGRVENSCDIRVIGIKDQIGNRDKAYCLVNYDKDGNYEVRALIKDYTGCILQGKNKTLNHYIISHIWGNAHDPRYFTNLWNVVLVPFYANPLLDKNYDDVPDHVGNKLLQVIKSIISTLYEFDKLPWNEILMKNPAEGFSVQEDVYEVNCLCRKVNGENIRVEQKIVHC